MQILLRFDNLGTSFDGTAAVSGGAAINALGVGVSGANRQGMLIQNHSATDNIWYKLNQSTVPTVSSTSHHGVVEPGKQVFIAAGRACNVWVQSSSAANTATFTAVEVC